MELTPEEIAHKFRDRLTNELKARFIHLYHGQKVMYIGGVGLQVIGKGGWNVLHPDVFLELRPLSSITEEEAKELADIDLVHPPDENKVKWVIENINHIIEFRNSSDWLRSKGFLLPFMGIWSFQWVEWGVVKLKTE